MLSQQHIQSATACNNLSLTSCSLCIGALIYHYIVYIYAAAVLCTLLVSHPDSRQQIPYSRKLIVRFYFRYFRYGEPQLTTKILIVSYSDDVRDKTTKIQFQGLITKI